MQERRGFTLIELIIVMSIIGVIYTILIQNFTFNNEDKESVSIATLPNFLRKHYGQEKSLVQLRCFDECGECYIFEDGKMQEDTFKLFESQKKVKTYTLGRYMLKQMEFGEYYVDEYESKDVCFEYNLYPNGSSDKIVVEYNDKAYLLGNYKQKTKVFDSVQDAEDFWKKQKNIVLKG